MSKKYEQPKTMIIRLPEKIVAELRRMKLDKDLPTIGSALKFWIEQQQNEKIEARLNETENLVNRMLNVLFDMNKQIESRFTKTTLNEYANRFMLALVIKGIGIKNITNDQGLQKTITEAVKNILADNKALDQTRDSIK